MLTLSPRSLQSDIVDALDAHSQSLEAKPANTIKSVLSGSLPVPCLDKDDFPHITYWNRKDYYIAKKEKKGITNIQHSTESHGNVMTWYVEDINGKVVSAQKVEQYRVDVRSIWQYFLNNGMALNTWAEANLAAMNYYKHQMCTRHPDFSYGANNWKAHQIATDNDPSWAAGHLSHPFKVKHEAKIQNAPKRSTSSKLYSRPSKKLRLNPASTKTEVKNHAQVPDKANGMLKVSICISVLSKTHLIDVISRFEIHCGFFSILYLILR